ncbi:holin [Streptomyces sp. SCSIO ZS0520]|uniref:holin n=1 Tax=Streptomyces sp. SCSIO ZS0520 TaxID=2892996 RepID=UPI0021D8EC75|nr:holin [Streptomyces sp. SCSIO ZS0520]
MGTAAFWRATGERAVRTFAQAELALLTGDGLGVLDIDWGEALSVGGLAAIAAVLTAIVAYGAGPVGPGLTETPAPARGDVHTPRSGS